MREEEDQIRGWSRMRMVRWEGEEIEFVNSRRDVSKELLARVHGSIDEDDVAAAKGAKEVN